MQVQNLRLEVGGFSISDYRIHEGDLEFRILNADGHSDHNSCSSWTRLTPNEIALHFRLNTIVGQWFQDKVTGWQQ
jgi:hypothetical protein